MLHLVSFVDGDMKLPIYKEIVKSKSKYQPDMSFVKIGGIDQMLRIADGSDLNLWLSENQFSTPDNIKMTSVGLLDRNDTDIPFVIKPGRKNFNLSIHSKYVVNGDEVIFVTINKNRYRLLDYELDEHCNILSSFYKNTSDDYNHTGCCITVKTDELYNRKMNEMPVVSLKLHDTYSDVLYLYKIWIKYNHAGSLFIYFDVSDQISDKRRYKSIFKVSLTEDYYPPTITVISNEQDVDSLSKYKSSVRGLDITVIKDEDINKKEIIETLCKELKKHKVRAVTLSSNLNISTQMCREYGIIHIFKYLDGKFTCIK